MGIGTTLTLATLAAAGSAGATQRSGVHRRVQRRGQRAIDTEIQKKLQREANRATGARERQVALNAPARQLLTGVGGIRPGTTNTLVGV